MIITASNGRDYDLENLSDSDRALLIQLGHLQKPVEVQEVQADETTLVIPTQETLVIGEESVDAVKKSKKNESTRL
jgi:hypothetical protein